MVAVTSFVFGAFSDRVSYTRMIQIGHILSALAFFFMAISHNTLEFILGVVLFGIGKSLLDCSFSAIISSQSEHKNYERTFRIRSLFLNLSSVIGPILGIYLYTWKNCSIFYVAAITFIAAAAVLAFYSSNLPLTKTYTQRFSLSDTLQPLRNSNTIFWLGSSLSVMTCLAIFESMLPLITSANSTFIPFGFLLTLNSLVVIIVQCFLVLWQRNFSESTTIMWGFLGYSVGFLLFISPGPHGEMLVIGTIIFSSAEALLFPLLESILAKVAPDNNKASYFGVGEFEQLGFLVGPILGGFIFNFIGSGAMFLACSLLSIFGLMLMKQLLRKKTILETI